MAEVKYKVQDLRDLGDLGDLRLLAFGCFTHGHRQAVNPKAVSSAHCVQPATARAQGGFLE